MSECANRSTDECPDYRTDAEVAFDDEMWRLMAKMPMRTFDDMLALFKRAIRDDLINRLNLEAVKIQDKIT